MRAICVELFDSSSACPAQNLPASYAPRSGGFPAPVWIPSRTSSIIGSSGQALIVSRAPFVAIQQLQQPRGLLSPWERRYSSR